MAIASPPAATPAPATPATPRGAAATEGEAPPAPAGRRLRRFAAYGPRCPDCAGPLAFGEGCALCPICGYSRCGA